MEIQNIESGQESGELNEEEMKQLQHLIGTAPTPDEKSTIHTLLTKVITSKDTSKTANLTDTELGEPKLPVRTDQELALFCEEIANMPWFSEYFRKEGEITLATSLSRDAKLLEFAVTSNRQIGEIPKKQVKKNRGWFGFKSKK